LGTCEPSCTARPAKPFFILEACGPQKAAEHVVAPEPSPIGRRGSEPSDTRQRRSSPWQGGEVRSYMTHGSIGALLAVRHGLRLWDTWQHQSTPRQGGEVQSYRVHGSVRPISTGRLGPMLQDTWQCMDARPAPCPDLKPVCGGTRSVRYRQ
jgi:hypothetical protein